MSPRIFIVPNWLLFWCAAITFGHYVFIREKFKQDPVIMAHETIHTLQYKREGVVRFLFLYAFVLPFIWNPWRARWEAEAYAVNVRAGDSADWCASQISGPSYLWPCRKATALALLKEYAR
jgi:hypothetical protein